MKQRSWARTALVLMGLQAVLGALAYFVYGYRWASLLVGGLFLAAVWQVAATRLKGLAAWRVWAAALLFQLPGLIGSVNVLLEQVRLYRQNALGDILDFLMDTWHTVLLPWLTFLPGRVVPTHSGESLSVIFLALTLISPLLMVWVRLAAR